MNFVSVGRFRRLRALLLVRVRRLWPRHCCNSGVLKKSDCKRVVRLCSRPLRRLWRLMRSTTLDTHRRPAIGANASIVTWRPAATTPPRPSTRPPRGPLFRRRLSSRGGSLRAGAPSAPAAAIPGPGGDSAPGGRQVPRPADRCLALPPERNGQRCQDGRALVATWQRPLAGFASSTACCSARRHGNWPGVHCCGYANVPGGIRETASCRRCSEGQIARHICMTTIRNEAAAWAQAAETACEQVNGLAE